MHYHLTLSYWGQLQFIFHRCFFYCLIFLLMVECSFRWLVIKTRTRKIENSVQNVDLSSSIVATCCCTEELSMDTREASISNVQNVPTKLIRRVALKAIQTITEERSRISVTNVKSLTVAKCSEADTHVPLLLTEHYLLVRFAIRHSIQSVN